MFKSFRMQPSVNMKPKIIYLCYLPLMEKREKDFFIKEAGDAGFSVEYWDLTKIYFPDLALVGEVERSEVERSYVRKIESHADLGKMLSVPDIKRCFFVVMFTFDGRVIKLHRLLTKSNCSLIFFARTGLPLDYENESLFKKLLKYYRKYLNIDKIKQTYLYKLAKFYQRTGLIKNYDFVFAAGAADASQYNGRSRVVALNHPDYDNYLGVKNKADRIIKSEYCVFLDDNLVYDTDFKILNIKTIKSTSYFTSMRTFFDRIEKYFNLKVVVAAHPKAEYQGNEFGSREIFKDKTNELVKDCRFAIAHYSTSISFAVLYKKPIFFIYTSEMQNMRYIEAIKHFASVLDASILNIDDIHGNEDLYINPPNHLQYNDYKYKCLTSRYTENKLSAGLFIRYMNELAASVDSRQT